MDSYKRTLNLAAGAVLFLAVIFITACGSSSSAQSAEATATLPEPALTAAADIGPTPTSTSLPASVTDTPTPTPTPPTATLAPTQSPATLAATATRAPAGESPSPTRKVTGGTAGVTVQETTITLPTYPTKNYLTEQIDPVYNIPVYYFDRSAYEASGPMPTPVDYTGIILENRYLRLTFLPELGGRLYSALVKATDQEIFYHNPVVKASRYGVLQPYEANWWLATGGMEWAYPTQEHGYRFGVPWGHTVTQDAAGATITLSDTAPDRVGLEVKVRLPANGAFFTVAPTLINNGPDQSPVQLWVNAALTLGADSMSPSTQFVVPNDTVTVHSRGESGWAVPGERQAAPWPQIADTNLSDYNQWANYLGVFTPNRETPFMGAYNPETNLAIVRLPGSATGSGKLFAFGEDFPDRSYTDNGSQYFEIWGGANAGFWPEDDIPVSVGETLGWQESWWPLPQLGGLTWATEHVAIHLQQEGAGYSLSALVSRPGQARVQIFAADTPILEESFSADPATPMQWEFSADGPVRIQFTDDGDKTLLTYPVD